MSNAFVTLAKQLAKEQDTRISEAIVTAALTIYQCYEESRYSAPLPEKEAIIKAICRPARLGFINACPGAGKSRVLLCLAQALQEKMDEDKVWVCAPPSSPVAKDLANKIGHCRHITADHFNDIKPNSFVLIDEASLLNRDLFEQILIQAQNNNLWIRFFGDFRQIGPPVFEKLISACPDLTVTLTDNHRQRDVEDNQAVRHIWEGDWKSALQFYKKRGKIVWCRNEDATRKTLLEHYNADTQKPLILTRDGSANQFKDNALSLSQAQGRSEDHVLLYVNGPMTLSELCVALSRHKQSLTLFVSQKNCPDITHFIAPYKPLSPALINLYTL